MAAGGDVERTSIYKRVAIIGSGCAAFGAAYALKDTDYEVHIYEKDARLGGHTNTQTWTKNGASTPVDTGFIVMNSATYPNFINFLKDVGVPFKATEMSFAVSRDQGKLEWSGSGKGIFAQRRNLFRLGHWRMILDIMRFEQHALDLLRRDDEEARSITIGRYLTKEGYSQAFKDDYLIPMTAAVWSTSPDKTSLEFPAQTLIRFMWNHHLLSTISRRLDWLTIPGGSQQYIDAIVQAYPKGRLHIHRSAQVIGINRSPEGTNMPSRLFWQSKQTDQTPATTHNDTFGHVIFACHGDQVLPILTGTSPDRRDSLQTTDQPKNTATEEERALFSAFQTTRNECYLHSDLSLMPVRPDTWSSWNYLISTSHGPPSKLPAPAGVSLTYNMNILQHLSRKLYGDVLVTMNPPHPPAADSIQGKFSYEHPLYTVAAVRAQEKLGTLQNKRGVSYAGAWTKYGFHEDGFSSGVRVAVEHLGATVPFDFADSTFSRGAVPPAPGLLDLVIRLVVWVLGLGVRLLEGVLGLPGVGLLVALAMFFPLKVVEGLEGAGVIA